MKNTNRDYKRMIVEPIANTKGVLIGILLLILGFIVISSDVLHGNGYIYLLSGLIIIPRIVFLPWIYRIAKNTGKNELLWTVLGIILPAIVLKILLKVEGRVAIRMVNNKRRDLRRERSLAQEKFSGDELEYKIEEIKVRIKKELQQELEEHYSV